LIFVYVLYQKDKHRMSLLYCMLLFVDYFVVYWAEGLKVQ